MKEMQVVVTMDCERPRTETHAQATGPRSYAESERFIRGYVAVAAEHGFPVSFFVHPEVALAHAALFKELAAKGSTVGLHIHPWKYMDGRYKAHFGGLSAGEQRAILSEAIGLWLHAFGTRPIYFRSGTYSANDATFAALVELGFRGSSTSLPGRVLPALNVNWAGAEPDPHRAHRCFRQLAGTMELAEMPVSVDSSVTVEKPGHRYHPDLRPDWRDMDVRRLAGNAVAQVIARAPAIPVVNLGTHNDNDYTDPDDRVCRNFRAELEEIHAACARAGVRPVGATVDAICDRVLAEPAREAEFAYV
ncbi:MAG: polysaccharide deacetylase family protein [Proteobacteria bacterium]|nr:polysaccharide deacetylase family protein [Pseudomonadota bacterium]